MKPLRKIILMLALVATVALSLTACFTPVDPGNDPLVVRVEQVETIGLSTFQTFLKIDDANRAFFKTNAPAMHEFAEYLRFKKKDGDRRYVSYLRSLSQIKLDYKAGKASSNDVVRVLGVVQSTLNQVNKFQLEN